MSPQAENLPSKGKRVAIYARYSSELQNPRSVADQLRVCMERAERLGWSVCQCYSDAAISGTSMKRAGLQQLLGDARDGRCDIILAEALDRLSRDQADIATIFKKMTFAGIDIVTLSEGHVGIVDIGLRGTMNQLYSIELANKVRRGQVSRIKEGRPAGARRYGYDIIRKVDAKGELIRGILRINEREARAIRRIFREYAGGRSPRSVKKRRYELNQLLAGMHRAGVDVRDLRRLADLCDVDLVRKGLAFHIGRHRKRHGKDADPGSSTMIGGIADAIRIVAKHYVKAPEPVVRELTEIACRFSRRSDGMTEKNRARLNQLDSPEVRRKFLSHALIEMGKLARKPKITRRDAIRYSILLAIEILIVAPMRIENIAELDVDVHFVWPPHEKGEATIVVSSRSVKNKVDLEYKIPRGSMPALDAYLKRFHPLLLKDLSSALFPGWRGQTKRSDTLSGQIKDLIRKELGIDWTPHVYRHFAARLYLRHHPGDYEGARRLLGHRSAETTYRFYEGEEMGPAVDRYDAVIDSIRDQDQFNAAFRNRYRDAKTKKD
jgi:DNA invertase Pin-like site-specific DNA recombinase